MAEESILCDPATGGWMYSGAIKNTSPYTMGEGHIVFTAPAGLSGYDQTLSVGTLLSGGITAFSAPIDAPAQAGDTVCFTVALHAANDDSQHTQYCNFSDCIVLPDCGV